MMRMATAMAVRKNIMCRLVSSGRASLDNLRSMLVCNTVHDQKSRMDPEFFVRWHARMDSRYRINHITKFLTHIF